MSNEKYPRIEPGIFKMPSALKKEIEQVSAKEHRSGSSTIYYLVVKGLKAYYNDGRLIEDANELSFLERAGTPVVHGRQRKTRTG
jgi:hypothetical protein